VVRAIHYPQILSSEIRQKVEVEGNIGKMIIIDIETGDYEIEEAGLQAAHNLYAKHPYARLFGIQIGYNRWCNGACQ
jgi:hypothetical protein